MGGVVTRVPCVPPDPCRCGGETNSTSPNTPRYRACSGSSREPLRLTPRTTTTPTPTPTPRRRTGGGSSSASSTTPTRPRHKGGPRPGTTPCDCMLVEEEVEGDAMLTTVVVGAVVVLLHPTPTSPRAEWANC